MTEDMHRDLAWLMQFIPIFNGTTTYDQVIIEANETLHIDTCLIAVGVGDQKSILLNYLNILLIIIHIIMK